MAAILTTNDSRLSEPMRGRKTTFVAYVGRPGGRWMDQFVCLSGCGKIGGWVGQGMDHIVWVCDDCANKYGEPPLPRLAEPTAGGKFFPGADFFRGLLRRALPKRGK